MRKQSLYKLLIFLNILILQLSFLAVGPRLVIIEGPTDVDEILNGPYAGNFLVTDGLGAVRIIDLTNREILWATEEPTFFSHSSAIHPDGNSVFIGDTGRDRVIEMNISNKVIIWEWDAKNITCVNWTDYGLKWGWSAESFAIVDNLNPATGYYTHLNSVDFINGTKFGRSYDSILISIRNFDLIIEVNHTAKSPSDPGYMNITWHYGRPGDRSIIYHQHAPRRLLNGHTTICDSEVGRIIEINETNQVVWEYWDKNLRWPRDCVNIPNGNCLIVDSNNNRIIEVNKTTSAMIRSFSDHLITPYGAEYTSDGRVLVGMPRSNKILILDYETGEILDEIGFSFTLTPIVLGFLMIIGYHTIDLISFWLRNGDKSVQTRLKMHKFHKKVILIVALILVLILFKYIISFNWHFGLWNLSEHIPRPSW